MTLSTRTILFTRSSYMIPSRASNTKRTAEGIRISGDSDLIENMDASERMETDQDSVWEDLVLSILSVNGYSLENSYSAVRTLRREGLFNPSNLSRWSPEEIETRLRRGGYNRGIFMHISLPYACRASVRSRLIRVTRVLIDRIGRIFLGLEPPLCFGARLSSLHQKLT